LRCLRRPGRADCGARAGDLLLSQVPKVTLSKFQNPKANSQTKSESLNSNTKTKLNYIFAALMKPQRPIPFPVHFALTAKVFRPVGLKEGEFFYTPRGSTPL
jgi:hypothetical protein